MARAAACLLHINKYIYKVKFAQFKHLASHFSMLFHVQCLIDRVLYKYFIVIIIITILLLLAQFCIR